MRTSFGVQQRWAGLACWQVASRDAGALATSTEAAKVIILNVHNLAD